MNDIERAALKAEAMQSTMERAAAVVRGRAAEDALERADCARRIAEAIRALPRSEWLDRVPTPEEIRAHAEAHGRNGVGRWLYQSHGGGVLRVVGHDGSWPGRGRYRPFASDGTPVPWPDVPAAPQEVDRDP